MAIAVAKKLIQIAVGTEKVASDGQKYRYLGKQWGKINPKSGKTSQMARKAIGAELNTLAQTPKRGSKATKAKRSAAWFKTKVGESAKGMKKRAVLKPGRMFTFGYDAKHKKTLPYWDRFPLIVVLDVYKDGFIGLNFHYLSPVERAKFLSKIMKFASEKGDTDSMSDKAHFKLSWDAVRNINGAEKMIHKYLYGHVKTSLLEAPANEWENVIYLPYQKFVGASAKSVWGK
ncbi:MAG: hypothetical protein HOH07_03390 [Euryarchaeota archaeon]|jgi:hypothetical protein|nr:hypothetical protein [Euryarchaeota archaeon]